MRYQEASFRGIQFHVQRAPSEFGRNKVVHEFPFKDKPLIEDMGKMVKKFNIKGFLVGDDYNFTRDLLIKASEEIGPGQLIHPYLGIKQVECLSLQIDESFTNGSFARIGFKFIEAGEASQGRFVDSALELIDAADEFILDTTRQFSEAFSVVKAPGFIVESAAALVDRIGDSILSQNGLGVTGSAISDLSQGIDELKAESASLVRSPDKLASKISGELSKLEKSFSNKDDSIEAVISSSRIPINEEIPLFNTKNRKQEKENHDQLLLLINNLAIGTSSAALGEYIRDPNLGAQNVSIGDIVKLRDKILEHLEGNLDQLSLYPQLFQETLNLKTKLLKSVPGALELPETNTVLINDMVSAFVLSYRIYGTPDRAMEIVHRNSIPNPAFIEPGTTIEYVK